MKIRSNKGKVTPKPEHAQPPAASLPAAGGSAMDVNIDVMDDEWSEKPKYAGNLKTVRKKEEVIVALNAFLGVVSYACKKVKISRETFYLWKREDQEFGKQVDRVIETQIDFVEKKLLDRVMKEDTIAILFYLKCKAKHRGYLEQTRVEHTGADGGAIYTVNGNLNLDVAKEEIPVESLASVVRDVLAGKANQFAKKIESTKNPLKTLPPAGG